MVGVLTVLLSPPLRRLHLVRSPVNTSWCSVAPNYSPADSISPLFLSRQAFTVQQPNDTIATFARDPSTWSETSNATYWRTREKNHSSAHTAHTRPIEKGTCYGTWHRSIMINLANLLSVRYWPFNLVNALHKLNSAVREYGQILELP